MSDNAAKIGVCYYPEHWPEENWVHDAALMVQAGISWVRIGEFAWSRIEPQPDQFEWDWLDRAIETLADAGLTIVMGTPTATPPYWIVKKHPDMLAVNADGTPRKFGSRRHYCFSHQGYRDECKRIVEILAERYGKHGAIRAWQTDNEYGCHDTIISYSDAARREFRHWLAQKYQSPSALNTAWGNVFWSMEYQDFDEIDLPNLTVTEPNPAHVMDFRRFSSDQGVRFNALQCDILRQFTDADLIHNYMGRTTSFDHFDVGKDLDVASWDSYPLGYLDIFSGASETFKSTFVRQGDPDAQAFHHNLYRAVGKSRFWIMEQQPGPVNWADHNPIPLDGMVRLWGLEAIAHGAEVVSYFRWRQANFAQEQMHAGLLNSDGSEAQGIKEVRLLAQDIEAIGPLVQLKAPVALVFDYASQWAWETQAQAKSFDYFGLIYQTYQSFRSLGLDVDIISPDADIEGYELVCAPGLFSLNEQLKAKFADFTGSILSGPRFNSKTDNFEIPTPLPPNIDGLDVKIKRVDSMREGLTRPLKNGGEAIIWFEEIETSAQIIEQTKDGHPVLVRQNQHYYLGAYLERKTMDRIFRELLESIGIGCETLPDCLRLRQTKQRRFVFNYSNEDQTYRGKTVPAAGVYWV